MQTALITGATNGIGLELARIMASKGHPLILVSRSTEKLSKVKSDLESSGAVIVRIVEADLSQPNSAQMVYETCKQDSVRILVNNAGAGLIGNFFEQDLGTMSAMMQLNMVSLMQLSYLFGKDMIAAKEGRILNIGSIVAFFPGPKQPVYYATKAFVRSLSLALARVTHTNGVTVTALHPGVTKTNFFTAAGRGAMKGGADPHSVALYGYQAMMRGKAEAVYGFGNKVLTTVFTRLIPAKLQAALIDKAGDA